MLLQKPVWLLELMADSPPPPLTSDFRPVRAPILLYTTPLDTHMLKINHYEKKREQNVELQIFIEISVILSCVRMRACMCRLAYVQLVGTWSQDNFQESVFSFYHM